MKKNIGIVIIIAITFLLCGCPTPVNSGETETEAVKFYKTLIGKDLTTTTGPLVVYDKNQTATEISEDKLSANVRTAEGDSVNGWHPLTKDIMIFYPNSEILSLSASEKKLYDGSDASFAEVEVGCTLPNLVYSYVSAVKGDFDGDLIEDAFVIGFDTYSGDMAYQVGIMNEWSSLVKFNGEFGFAAYINSLAGNSSDGAEVYMNKRNMMATGDVDNDGKDEVLITDGSSIYMCDIESTTDITITRIFTHALTKYKIFGLTCGDFLDNSGAEIISQSSAGDPHIAQIINYSAEKDENDNYIVQTGGNVGTDTTSHFLIEDFTGDGVNDLLEMFYTDSNYQFKVWSISGNTITTNTPLKKISYTFSGDAKDYSPVALDTDMDNVKEIFWVNQHFDYMNNKSTTLSSLTCHKPGAGDFNRDKKDDIVGGETSVVVYSKDSSGNFNQYKSYFERTADNGTAIFIVGNYDNDSVRLQYAGHTLTFSNPIIIAVLASAPYYADLLADYDNYSPSNWTTTYGKSTTNTNSYSGTVGVSVGAGVEFEQSLEVFGIEIASISASVEFKTSFRSEFSSEMSISSSMSYYGTAGEDRVIFTAIPIDVFTYEFAGTEYEPIVIQIPRAASQFSQDIEFFNKNNGDFADITLAHTKGVPSSYRTSTERDELLATYSTYYLSSEASAAGFNNNNTSGGGTTLEITVEETKGYAIEVENEAEMSAGAGAGGVTATVSEGFSTAFNYSNAVTEGTFFEGMVGNIPYNASLTDTVKPSYSQGMFVYPNVTNGQRYWVVDYWVDIK